MYGFACKIYRKKVLLNVLCAIMHILDDTNQSREKEGNIQMKRNTFAKVLRSACAYLIIFGLVAQMLPTTALAAD